MGRTALLACPEGGMSLSAMAGLDRSSFNTEPGLRSISFSIWCICRGLLEPFFAPPSGAGAEKVDNSPLFVLVRVWYTILTTGAQLFAVGKQERQDVKSSDERWFFESSSPLARASGGGLRLQHSADPHRAR